MIVLYILQLIYCRSVRRWLYKLSAECKWTELISSELPIVVWAIPIVGPVIVTVSAAIDYSEVKEELRRSGNIVTRSNTWLTKIIDWLDNADLKK